jgi:hypothetical protein
MALEAVKRIDAIFDLEREIDGASAEERLRVRRETSAPLVATLKLWLRAERANSRATPPSPKPSITCSPDGRRSRARDE